MVRRIGFDDEEATGAVRRRGQRWRAERTPVEHRHDPVTQEVRTRRMEERLRKRDGVLTTPQQERGGFGRILWNPVVLILGLLLFHVFFITFLIVRAVWLARLKRRPTLSV